MNYSTLKKGIVASLFAVAGVTSLANAQEATGSTSASSSNLKLFGGAKPYRTWSFGINGGLMAPVVVIGGSDDFQRWDPNLGYGISLRKQFNHLFGVQGNISRGTLSGNNNTTRVPVSAKEFKTSIQYAADLRAYLNIGSINFLHRKNALNLFLTAGYGVTAFDPTVTGNDGVQRQWSTIKERSQWFPEKERSTINDKYVKQSYIPVGAGLKFKISDGIAFNLAYTMNFVDGDNLDGTYENYSSKDKFSYTSIGLEFALGSKSRPNMDWVNPVAITYDELNKDSGLRQEIDALKSRVANVEKSVEDLKKDSDGDGVSDQFDKCPGTPAGTAVDGSGCPLPKVESAPVANLTTEGVSDDGNIQFDFNSSVLKTESYPVLDKLSESLREQNGKVTVTGYASNEGTAAYNLKLSKDRANAVKTYLVNSGVPANKVKTVGKGEANPIASNDTEEGRIQNRRVETSKN